jgi:AraC-like DNA-binding protein
METIVPDQRFTRPDGILNPKTSEIKFQLERYQPSEKVSCFVERYWSIHWDLRGEAPYLSENLPFPCVNMVIEPEQSGIFGIVTGKFTHCLEGQSAVFAIKFRPGAFYPFFQQSVSHLTNQAIPIAAVFGNAGRVYEAEILSLHDDAEKVTVAEAFLQARLPVYDDTITRINQIIDCIIAEPSITQVDDVLEYVHMSKRTMQRIFKQYVGVSPKWVIMRYRLQEAADYVAKGHIQDWSALAQKLGYFDQAHFIKDFKAIIGRTPVEYAVFCQTERSMSFLPD